MGVVNRQGLLIVRAGDRSLHPHWLKGISAESRTWDLHVSYFGDRELDPSSFPEITMTREKGTKWLGIQECLSKLGTRVDAYDYIGFPDDDLFAPGPTWNVLFEVLNLYAPTLAQPALDRRSFFSYATLLQQRGLLLRWTDYVEAMCPVFSRKALSICRHTFSESVSGWGLDGLWAQLLAGEDPGLCVVDAAPVLHTRAIGAGPLYSVAREAGGTSPVDEMKRIYDKYGLSKTPIRVSSCVDPKGKSSPGYTSPTQVPLLLRSREWIRRQLSITTIELDDGQK